MIRVNLAGQSSFDLRSPLNGCRDYEIVFAREFDVVDACSRTRRAVVEMIVVEIKHRLNSRT